MIDRILVFGDDPGASTLTHHLPREVVVGIVGAAIRPQYTVALQSLADSIDVPFLIQPKWGAKEYESFVEKIRALAPDLILVNSYSMIIRDDILAQSRLGGLNIHGALLPRNRGCNPIQWAIINGETETGVTLHQIDSGLDTGPIVDQRAIPILFGDSWMDVRAKLEQSTDELIVSNLQSILAGEWTTYPQIDARATVGRRRTSEDGYFSWSDPIIDIYNKVRALLAPLPPAFYVSKDGQKITMDSFLTIGQLSALKYDPMVGGEELLVGGIRLRPLLNNEFKNLDEWLIDPKFLTLTQPNPSTSETDQEVCFEKMMTSHADVVMFLVEDLASSQVIGACQFVNINWSLRNAELRFRFRDHVNLSHEIEFETVKTLCDFGFSDLNLHKIAVHVPKSDVRTMQTYSECGFVVEESTSGLANLDGQWIEVQIMVFNKK